MNRLAVVTGAHGFIGRHIARALASRGWRVRGIGHGDWAELEWRQWGLDSWREGELNDASLSELFVSAELVVHAAGGASVSVAEADPQLNWSRTVGATREVIAAIRQLSACRLIYLSSAAVYGDSPIQPIPESTSPTPISVYGRHKREAELLAEELAQIRSGDVCCLRLFSVYGPGLRKQLLWDACRRYSSGERTFFGSGQEVRDWCHVEDVAALVVRLADRSKPWPLHLNGGTGIGTTTRRVLEILSDHCGATSGPQFNGVVRVGDPPVYIADVGLVRGLGFEATWPLARGLAGYADWFKDCR